MAHDGLVQFSSYVGMRWPAHSSAVGKALLAFLPDSELHRVLRQMRLTRVTSRTLTSRRALEAHLRSFRRLGYTWEMEEGEMGVACVAAPLYGPDGRVVAAASVTGTTNQIPKRRVAATGALVKRYAHLMSARVGAQPAPHTARARQAIVI